MGQTHASIGRVNTNAAMDSTTSKVAQLIDASLPAVNMYAASVISSKTRSPLRKAAIVDFPGEVADLLALNPSQQPSSQNSDTGFGRKRGRDTYSQPKTSMLCETVK